MQTANLSNRWIAQIKKHHFAFRRTDPKSIVISYEDFSTQAGLMLDRHQMVQHNKQLFYFLMFAGRAGWDCERVPDSVLIDN